MTPEGAVTPALLKSPETVSGVIHASVLASKPGIHTGVLAGVVLPQFARD